MTRDRAEFLPGAFAQLREQKGADDELVVVGYLPDDATYNGVKENEAIVDKLLHFRADSGAEGVNAAIGLLEGEYVRIVADDDFTDAEQMERAIQVMDEYSDIDLLVCGGVKEDTATGRKGFGYVPRGASYAEKPQDVLAWGACGVGFLFRRSIFEKVRFDANPVADITFAINCIKAGLTVKFCRINLYRHPIYPHSNLNAKKKEVNRALKALYKAHDFVWKPHPIMSISWDGSLT